VPIDVTVARAQHAEYERALALAGCEIRHVPAAHDYPDSVFIEDTAIVLDEVAIIARPGAESRRGETAAVAAVLSASRQLQLLSAPATLDGGDVLRLGRTLYLGIGARTNAAAFTQLADVVRSFGYVVRGVSVSDCLHLKSAVTELAEGLVLLNPEWVDGAAFEHHRAIEVDPSEPFAANVLRIGGTILCASSYDRTRVRLQAAGLHLRAVDVSELAKAEAGVTCCSLLLNG
jgi:dimethylargininase